MLEQASRVGGLVESEALPGGFLLEHGADCLLTTKPWGLAALQELGIDDTIVFGHEPRRVFVAAGDRLVPLPTLFAGATPASLWGLVRSPLLGWREKLRAMAEPLVPCPPQTADESVAAFVGRRFGAGVVPSLVEPLLRSVYGGTARELSAASCLPALRAMEREGAGIIRGIERARRRHREAGRLPDMISLRGGMASLPNAFARSLGSRVRLGVTVTQIERAARGFRLETSAGAEIADGVVLATPAWVAARLIERLDPTLASQLGGIPHVALDCVSMAWRRDDVGHALGGTGFVSPAATPRPTQACTWAHRKWPCRAPEGWVLLRSVLRAAAAETAEVVEAARRDVRELLGIRQSPALLRVRRLPRATPIYRVGHRDVVAAIQARSAALGGVALAGNAYGGIGIPDCLASAEAAAVNAVKRIHPRG